MKIAKSLELLCILFLFFLKYNTFSSTIFSLSLSTENKTLLPFDFFRLSLQCLYCIFLASFDRVKKKTDKENWKKNFKNELNSCHSYEICTPWLIQFFINFFYLNFKLARKPVNTTSQTYGPSWLGLL